MLLSPHLIFFYLFYFYDLYFESVSIFLFLSIFIAAHSPIVLFVSASKRLVFFSLARNIESLFFCIESFVCIYDVKWFIWKLFLQNARLIHYFFFISTSSLDSRLFYREHFFFFLFKSSIQTAKRFSSIQTVIVYWYIVQNTVVCSFLRADDKLFVDVVVVRCRQLVVHVVIFFFFMVMMMSSRKSQITEIKNKYITQLISAKGAFMFQLLLALYAWKNLPKYFIKMKYIRFIFHAILISVVFYDMISCANQTSIHG